MTQVSAAMIKDLRGKTGAGMMDCKKALTETDGDVEVAVDALVSPPYYRLMLGMAPLDDAGVAALVNTVWCGCRGAREAGS